MSLNNPKLLDKNTLEIKYITLCKMMADEFDCSVDHIDAQVRLCIVQANFEILEILEESEEEVHLNG